MYPYLQKYSQCNETECLSSILPTTDYLPVPALHAATDVVEIQGEEDE
jgi:hypothetical protein